MEIENNNIILCGDHHGKWDIIFNKLDFYTLKDCIFIHVGDGGEGFITQELKQLRQFNILNERFKKRNIQYYSIRGNHSNKRWFDGSISLSHFKLIQDYTVIKINGETWQFVGGAISVDRVYRKEGHSYWKDEFFIFDPTKAVKCDVLVTHSGPPWIGPNHKGEFVTSFYDRDPTLKDELIVERKLHQDLLDICQPKKHYCGHFHTSEVVKRYIQSGYETESRILDINEFYPYRKQ
jgi:hypothetical protein